MNGKLTKWPGVFKETKKKTFKEAEEEVDQKLQDDIGQFVDEAFKHIICYAFCIKVQKEIRVSLEPAVEDYLETSSCVLVVNDKFKSKLQSFLDKEYPNKYTVKKPLNKDLAYKEEYSISFIEK